MFQVNFLKEFCAFSQTLQPQNRDAFFKTLSNMGILPALEVILVSQLRFLCGNNFFYLQSCCCFLNKYDKLQSCGFLKHLLHLSCLSLKFSTLYLFFLNFKTSYNMALVGPLSILLFLYFFSIHILIFMCSLVYKEESREVEQRTMKP